MTIIHQQFEALKLLENGAELLGNSDGSFRVHVPNVRLPPGWTAPATDIWFVLPVGYPAARPDCFWASGGLRLSDGRVPQNTGSNPLPFGPPSLLWFSWHAQAWSPLSDTIITYFHLVKARFLDLK